MSLRSISSKASSIALLGIAAAVLSACGHSQAAVPAASLTLPQVTVAPVLVQPLRHWHDLTGTLQAVDTVEVHPRVSGYINSVHFVEGAQVAKGELLFQIDPRPFQFEVERLRAEVERARSHLELTRADHARAERLISQNAIAREEYEQLSSAETEATAALAATQAQFDAARLNLEFTQVRSPINGRASRALITPGNLVSNASALTTVVSDDPIYAYFDADEATYLTFTQRAAAHSGHDASSRSAPVYMGLVGEDGYPHQGRLDFLDNQIDSRSGTIRARAVFDNRDGHFTPGLFARIKLVSADSYQAVLVDDRAIGTDLDKKYVLVLQPDHSVAYRPVQLGPDIDGLRVVQSGLAAGDVIVVNGLQHVTPGAKVQPSVARMQGNREALGQVAASDPVETPPARPDGSMLAVARRAR
ncbi:MAG TPA: efflux RND transporter periplasmic adaptor subunit [Steroidobacteraceae bacterium]|jgi:multidrug efflux system membrane fusion protein|nr:efflux RND transporter periplasmic adaptor subunit [Steroidobacteraceae bacterium]